MSDAVPMLSSAEAHNLLNPPAQESRRDPAAGGEPQVFNGLLQGYLLDSMEAGESAEIPGLPLPPGLMPGAEAIDTGKSLPLQHPLLAWSSAMPGNDPHAGRIPAMPLTQDAELPPPGALRPGTSPVAQPLEPRQPQTLAAWQTIQHNPAELQTLVKAASSMAQQPQADTQLPANLSNSGHSGTVGDPAINLNTLLNSTAGQSGGAARSDSMPAPLNLPPQHPGWGAALGERIQWMLGQNLQRAEIRLDPPELGALEIKISVNRDQVQLSVMTATPQVRDAVEAAVGRLREMFNEVGLQLGDVNVSQESFAQQQHSGDHDASAGSRVAEGLGESETEADVQTGHTPLNSAGQGLLDLYA